MVRATLRTAVAPPQTSAPGQATPVARPAAAAAAKPAPQPVARPAARPAAPAPAIVAQPPAQAPAAPAQKLVTPPAARPVANKPAAAPAVIPVTPGKPAAPRKTLAARPAAPKPPAKPAPIVDVQATVIRETITTPTPVEGVTVECANTAAVPATSVEDALLPAAEEVPASPEPAGVTAEQAEAIEFEAGRQAALDPNGVLLDRASQAAIRGWNSVLNPEPITAAPVEEAPPAQALIVRPPSAMQQCNYAKGKAFIGDYNQTDVRLPSLKIVQGSGPLSQVWNDGTILFADQDLLPPADLKPGAVNPVLRFVPVQMIKQFREAISKEDQEAGMMPRTANSAREVEEEFGGTVVWGNGEQPSNYWRPSSKNLIVIEMPEGSEHPSFVVELDGKLYAPAIYYAAGTAYNSFHLMVLNTAATLLQFPVLGPDGQPQKDETGHVIKEPMPHRFFWTMGFARKTLKKSDFTPWAPIVKLRSKEATGPELREYCEGLISSQVAAREVSQGD